MSSYADLHFTVNTFKLFWHIMIFNMKILDTTGATNTTEYNNDVNWVVELRAHLSLQWNIDRYLPFVWLLQNRQNLVVLYIENHFIQVLMYVLLYFWIALMIFTRGLTHNDRWWKIRGAAILLCVPKWLEYNVMFYIFYCFRFVLFLW